MAKTIDAFTMDWAQIRDYANPPHGASWEGYWPKLTCISGTSVESPDLVPSTTGHATTDLPEGGSDPTHTP